MLEGIRLPGGGTEWSHAFVEAQFVGQLINRRHIYETTLRPIIGQNRDLREVADYAPEGVAEIRAIRALQRAERFVKAIVDRQEARS